jgi:hypothetical protein
VVRFPCGTRSTGFDATEITFTVPVGTTAGTNRFALSENDGTAGADPYGHIHGRMFSATVPGWYVAGFRLVDTGRNGPGGGPRHAPSDLAYFNFRRRHDRRRDPIRGRRAFASGRTPAIPISSRVRTRSARERCGKRSPVPLRAPGGWPPPKTIAISNAVAFLRLRVNSDPSAGVPARENAIRMSQVLGTGRP